MTVGSFADDYALWRAHDENNYSINTASLEGTKVTLMKFISTFIFLLNSVFSVIVSERDELCVSGPNAACIPFVKTFDNPKLFINYTRLFIGIHGMGSDALNFSNILADTTLIGSCMSNSLIIGIII